MKPTAQEAAEAQGAPRLSRWAQAVWWLRTRLRRNEGFTLVELMVVILLASILSVAVLMILMSSTRVFNSQEVRILNQDDARQAINEVSRYLRMATSSADNHTTVSNAVELAQSQEVAFYCDVDGDGVAEKMRYFLSDDVLWSQTDEPEWVTAPEPDWQYDGYDGTGVVIVNRVRNGSEAVFTYYRYDEAGGVVAFDPTSDVLREEIVMVGITVKVGERPDLAARDVALTTRVQLRQRYEGGLK